MSHFKLLPCKPSYITEQNDAIHIFSPISTAKNYKGHIGIHLPGLQKPDTPQRIVFTPAANLQASNIQWSSNGATIYIMTTRGKPIVADQRIGTLKCTQIQQSAQIPVEGNLTFFYH